MELLSRSSLLMTNKYFIFSLFYLTIFSVASYKSSQLILCSLLIAVTLSYIQIIREAVRATLRRIQEGLENTHFSSKIPVNPINQINPSMYWLLILYFLKSFNPVQDKSWFEETSCPSHHPFHQGPVLAVHPVFPLILLKTNNPS